MEDFKKKLVENMNDDKTFFFNYLLYGRAGLITSKQFIPKVLLWDLMIMVFFLFYCIFLMFCFAETKLTGYRKFLVLVFIISLCSTIITVIMNFVA